MTRTATRITEDLDVMIDSFERHLRGEHKSPKTVLLYTQAARHLEGFLRDKGMPLAIGSITAEHVEAFMASLIDKGWRPATCNQTYRSLRQFWKWAMAEDEIRVSPMRNLAAPRVPDEPSRVVRP